MNLQKISLATLKRLFCGALFLPLAWAQAADMFDTTTGQVRLDSVVVGATRYQAVVVVPGTLVGFGTGAPKTSETYFDLTSGHLNIRSLMVGTTAYPDVVITIGSLESVGGSAPVQASGTAPANTLVGLDGQNYPLRVSVSLNASRQPSAITYDFHKTDGTMTPCTHSASNDATCHGAANTFNNITASGFPAATDPNPPANATLTVGPDSYGYSFEGKVTGMTWTGTWTAMRSTPSGITTQSGPFSVDVVIEQGNGQGNPNGSGSPSGPNPTILSQTFTPGTAAKLEVAFDMDMRSEFGTTGTYVPTKSYWANARLFVMELSSYTPGGNITLVGKSFVSTGGIPLAQDRIIVLP